MFRLTLLFCMIILLQGCADPYIQTEKAVTDVRSEKRLSASNESEKIGSVTEADSVCEPNGLLTLKNALQLTLLHNPELKAYSYDIGAAQARLRQAGLWKNPNLEIEVENVGGSGIFSGLDSAQTTIQLSQIIELGNKINKRKRVFSYGSELAEINYNAKRLDISTELTKSFIALLFIQEKHALSDELVHISDTIFKSVEKRFQAGKANSIELSKATVGLAQAKLQQLEITKYYTVTRVRLASYWNSRHPSFTATAGRLDELSEMPDFEDLKSHLRNNPDIMLSAIAVQQRKAEMALADTGRVPDLEIAGGVKHFNDPDETAFVFGLSIPLTISDRNQGGRMEAYQNYRKAQEMQTVSELSVWNELNRLYAEMQTAYRTATILRDEVMAASEQMFNAANVSYEQGKINYLELLDSQKIYFTSKNDYIDALADYHIAQTELERLIGQSIQDINMTLN